MPSDRSLRLMNRAHRLMLKVTGGRFGWFAKGMPMLELTTIGRKSGAKRSTMLSSPLRIHGSYIVVASRGGDDTHPAWFHNLVDNPRVEVVMQGEPARPFTARVANASERAHLWPQITAKHPHYAGYQKRTDREIPLVYLDPVE